MMSRADSRKKADKVLGTEKFKNDIETISKALNGDKKLPPRLSSSLSGCRSNSVGKSHLLDPKTKPKYAKEDKKDSSDREKKPSIWSWKRLKGLTNARNRRFNCCFSLQVHSVEGLPAFFDDVCLVVHWKRRDSEQMTHPVRVHQGVAMFEDQLTHSCSVNGSRNGPHQLTKYEAKHFLLYASVYNAPELDLGKHRIDLTRLLPLTLEELEEEKSSGKWTTSFRLLGKARGATLNVSFGYVATGNDSIQPCNNNSLPEILSLRQNNAKMENFVHQFDHVDELTICRGGSLPPRLSTSNQSPENIKDLHEVSPVPLCESVSVLYQKLGEISNASVKDKLDDDDLHKLNPFTPPDPDEKISETECGIGEFSVEGKGIEEFTEEQGMREEDSLKDAQDSGGALETDGNGIVEVARNEDEALHASAEEIVSLQEEQSTSTCISTEEKGDVFSKESLMKELETALSYATELMNEGLIDSHEDEIEDASEVLLQESSLDINSYLGDFRQGESLSLDDDADSVANYFLNMLGVEHSPFALSSESEPDSPRERLLRQFEKDVLANGGLLNFDIDNDATEFFSDILMGSVSEPTSTDFHQLSACEGLHEMHMVEAPSIDTDAFGTKTRASRLEDLETEALMRDWGLNERAFQHSPPSKPAGFGSSVDMHPEDREQLPLLAEGLGPLVQTKNGGFMRSMNPALFRNAKSGGSLIMQVSSPVVVPAEMGSGVMDVLEGLAAMGMEKLSMQANKLMPLEDITGKTVQQIAWEAAPALEGPERQGFLQNESEIVRNKHSEQKSGKGSTLQGSDTEYVSLEDLAPLAMDKIEALSMEGLRIQSGMLDEDAPSNISTQSIGGFSAMKGETLDVGGSIALDGTGGLQLLDIKDKCEDVDGLMGLSLTLDEWVKLDSGEIDDDDLLSERTSRVLAAHRATSLDQFRGRSKGERRRGRGKKYGLLGNNFTVALMVQLRDPLRNYEPVGTPMLGLIQVERVFAPTRPKIYRTVPLWNTNEEEGEPKATKNETTTELPMEEKIHEEDLVPQYKISEVHVSGFKTEPDTKKLWGSKNQQQSGSRWLLANGMGKKNKHPLMKSKAIVKNSGLASSTTTTVQPGDKLWSISGRVHGTGAK